MELVDRPEVQEISRSVERFCKLRLGKGRGSVGETCGFPSDIWKSIGQLGLLGLAVGANFGGCGLDLVDTVRVLESFGTHCLDNGLSFSVVAQTVGFSLPVERFGSERQKSSLLPRVLSGDVIGCQAITEEGAGSDAFAMRCSAVRTANGFLLNGSKIYITNAPVADHAMVFAITDPSSKALGGTTAFIVDLRLPGVTKGKPMNKVGLHSSQLGELHFDDVEVPGDAVLGGVGAGLFIFVYSLNLERVLFSSLHCGAIRRILDEAILYAKTRVQFGLPIGKNQAVSHRIADIHVDLECGRLLIRNAAEKLMRSPNSLCTEASVAKLFISEAYVRAGLACMQIHGAHGLMADAGLERELRDSLSSTIYAGTSEMQRNIIAKQLGL